jgi:hypothetical protein
LAAATSRSSYSYQLSTFLRIFNTIVHGWQTGARERHKLFRFPSWTCMHLRSLGHHQCTSLYFSYSSSLFSEHATSTLVELLVLLIALSRQRSQIKHFPSVLILFSLIFVLLELARLLPVRRCKTNSAALLSSIYPGAPGCWCLPVYMT